MNNKQVFYISSPIYYVNGKPHLGHVYSTLYADFIARFQRLKGSKVFFVTGCDQHGSKIAAAAELHHEKPEKFIKIKTKTFLALWDQIDITYTHFVETHNDAHQRFVVDIFQKFAQKDHIYFDQYRGFYCSTCESFLTQDKIFAKNNVQYCFICKKTPDFLSEKNFFFRITDQDLVNLKQWHQKWQQKNLGYNSFKQLEEFIKAKDLDFSVSRSQVKWAIALGPQFANQTAYVWFEALFSYISVLNADERQLVWNNNNSRIVHVLGKEISKFHLIYWPLFLSKMDYQLPHDFLIHGWILKNNEKMSKSIGNVVDVQEIINQYNVTVLRIFIAFLIKPNQDVKYNGRILVNFYRAYLVNNFSNYCYRLLTMVKKYKVDFTDIKNYQDQFASSCAIWKQKIQQFIDQYLIAFDNFAISEVIRVIFALLDYGNQEIERQKPWKLIENKREYLICFLFYCLIIMKIVALFWQPIAPQLSKDILKVLDLENNQVFDFNLNWKRSFVVDKVIKFFE